MIIRKLNQKDIPSCAEILKNVYNNALWQCRWDQETAECYLNDFFNMPKFIGYALEEDSTLCGAAFAREKIWWNNSEIYLEELFIRPDMQKKGFGKALLQKLEQDASANGWAGVTLSTNRYAPAAAFYKRNGYDVCEHVCFMAKEI